MDSWAQDERRFRELLLYVSQKCGQHGKFGATKLNKILFYSDFEAFARLGSPITGFQYQRIQNGPAPRRLKPIQADMVRRGDITIREVQLSRKHTQHRTVPLREPDLSIFTAQQLAIVNEVIAALKDHSAEEVSELSHLEVGWKAARENETIPYGTAFLSDSPLTKDEISRVQRFAEQHGFRSA